MRYVRLGIAVALIIFGLPSICRCSNVRTFHIDASKVRIPFYAETIWHVVSPKGRRTDIVYREWTQYPERFRGETRDLSHGSVTYFVRSGDDDFSAIRGRNARREPKWDATPAFWIGPISPYCARPRRLRMLNPQLVATTRMCGVEVEHWRGQTATGKVSPDRTLDVWWSKDKRFPVPLKVVISSRRSLVRWEIVGLQLDKPFPNYIFTPQIHPRGGILAQLTLQYKPAWMMVAWRALKLLGYAGLLFAIMTPKFRRRSTIQAACASAAVLGLLLVAPKPNHYLNQLSDLSMLLLNAAMTAGALAYCYRRLGMPGDIRLFSGTRWPIAPWIVVAAFVGLCLKSGHVEWIATNQLGLSHWRLVFLPQTLVTVAVYAGAAAALEEVVFRGYVMGRLGESLRSPRLVNLLQALAFTAMHVPKYLNQTGPGLRMLYLLACIFAFGMLFGWMRLRYRNLGAPWLVHTTYNIGWLYAANAGIYGVLVGIESI